LALKFILDLESALARLEFMKRARTLAARNELMDFIREAPER
jgi:hypothetical protein